MKIYINFLKFLIFLLLLSLLFTFSCDILSTYSEDEYLALAKKDKNKDKGNNESSNIEIILEDYNYTINNGGSFNFDNIPVIQRTSQIIFKIYNNGTESLELTGTPKIEINQATDFTVNQNITNTTISSNNWALFIITFTSTATDGNIKTATISIPNNSEDNNPFTFTVSCKAKGLNTVEFKNAGTTDWIFPVHSTTGNILLVGAGGGGGGGFSDKSGAGGGAGEVVQSTLTLEYNQIYTIIIGNGGTGGSDNSAVNQGNGGDGSHSQIIFNGNIILNADYGRGGESGYFSNNPRGGFGYPDIIGIGQNGGGLHGGHGGYNNFGGLESRGNGGTLYFSGGQHGHSGDPNTGAGGGGGSSSLSEFSYYGGPGSSGYCRIEYIGFSIP